MSTNQSVLVIEAGVEPIAAEIIERNLQHLQAQAPIIARTDGASAEFSQWGFNIRRSNTELCSGSMWKRSDPRPLCFSLARV